MKRERLPNLPINYRKQPSGLFMDSKTGKYYTFKALQAIYGTKPTQLPTEIKQELTEEQKTSWHHQYDNY